MSVDIDLTLALFAYTICSIIATNIPTMIASIKPRQVLFLPNKILPPSLILKSMGVSSFFRIGIRVAYIGEEFARPAGRKNQITNNISFITICSLTYYTLDTAIL